jgi:mitotic spindle assembly checkpoint protein MAD1
VPPTSKQVLEARYTNHKSGTDLETEEPPDVKLAAETEKSKDVRQYEALQKEVTELKDAAANEEAVLERRVGSR